MSDRELLERAAKAAGIKLDWDVPPKSPPWTITGVGDDRGPGSQWNPLTDDGDALRLAVKLEISTTYRASGCEATDLGLINTYELYGEDPCSAIRRAIVRAAVAIGERLP